MTYGERVLLPLAPGTTALPIVEGNVLYLLSPNSCFCNANRTDKKVKRDSYALFIIFQSMYGMSVSRLNIYS